MLIGPIFGSFLYELGGFKTPFFVTGILLFLLIFPILFLIENDKKKRNLNDDILARICKINELKRITEVDDENRQSSTPYVRPQRKITFF